MSKPASDSDSSPSSPRQIISATLKRQLTIPGRLLRTPAPQVAECSAIATESNVELKSTKPVLKYSCALKWGWFLSQGLLHLNEKEVSFKSVFLKQEVITIPFCDIQTAKKISYMLFPTALIIQTKTEFCFASFLARDACYAALEKRRASCKPIEFDRVLEFEGARICDSPIDSGDRHGITFKRQAHSSDKNRSPSTSSESYKNDTPHESKEPDFKENNLQNGGWMAKLIGSNTAASSYHGLLLMAVLFIAVNIVMAMMAMSTMYRLSLVMEELSGFEGTVAEE